MVRVPRHRRDDGMPTEQQADRLAQQIRARNSTLLYRIGTFHLPTQRSQPMIGSDRSATWTDDASSRGNGYTVRPLTRKLHLGI